MNAANEQPTIGQFLSDDQQELMQKLGAGLAGSSQARSIGVAIAAGGTGLTLSSVVKAIAEKFHEMLNTPVSDILTRAWNQSRELRKALDETRTKHETAMVPLLDHTIKSEQHPHIDLLEGEKPVARLAFAVELQVKLKGLVLKIDSGEIKEIVAGEIKLKGTVKLGEYIIAEKDFKPVRLFAEQVAV
jgi:hypothetical protein